MSFIFFSEGYYYYHLYNHVYLIGLAPLRHGEEMERLDLGRYSTQQSHDGDFLASSKSNESVMWMFYDIYIYIYIYIIATPKRIEK